MIQMSSTDDHIYPYDFSEAFNVVDLKSVIRTNDDVAVDRMRLQLQQFKRFTETDGFDVPGLAKGFYLEIGQLKDGMISTVKRAAEIIDEDLDALTDELMRCIRRQLQYIMRSAYVQSGRGQVGLIWREK